ncbi:ECF transporter S component [Oceanobacillus senegalensis]|uniref:ECF transporter S component n=1 Tax=Oceanobacillus senegalensis TaxID=1936063 RepID=UPI000A311751|nr:ECF transporter S component [Oceanobacillus senegalensis]
MNSRKISILALFIALSVVGAATKIPAIIGSVALDAFPALLAGTFFGIGAGAVVGGFGHMVSALIGGMPMGALHVVIAIEMALLVAMFTILIERGKNIFAAIIFVIGNVLLAPAPFIFLFGVEFYMALIPSLFIGSVLNVLVALIVYSRIRPFFVATYFKEEMKG